MDIQGVDTLKAVDVDSDSDSDADFDMIKEFQEIK